MGLEQEDEIPIEKTLRGLVARARTKTYAGNGKPVGHPAIEGTTQLEYKEGNYFYRDIYVTGENNFAGQEILYEDDKPIWSMVYFGSLNLSGLNQYPYYRRSSKREIYDFLKESLKDNATHVRFGEGITTINNEEFFYEDEPNKEFEGGVGFSGKEIIRFKGTVVYVMRYQGGPLPEGWVSNLTELKGLPPDATT
ncbi:MAG: hypothetical protein A3B44_02355 [Candidatus Levybacteria bacterium RIFCSPLOWO2_01_FULL_38_21]|nr:MAG: hypothetical protein A3B44_02355 [Candidatus Levybacteria bacterium RIFCSPLOWO2_01_FULL_38_21]